MGATPVLTISGSIILLQLLTSPIFLGVVAVVLLLSVAGLFFSRRKGGLWISRLAKARGVIAVAAILLLIAVLLYSVRPWYDYGLYVEVIDQSKQPRLVFLYMAGWRETSPLCGSIIEVRDKDEVLGELSKRDLGISDPLGDVYIGVYETRDGTKAYVLVVQKSSRALYIKRPDGSVFVIGVDGVEKAYRTLSEIEADYCS
ncbi:hypothetical protein [Aeropyrum camini]|uniref:Uncharacterized protein n=1 Tax=Aeropyrum camini SY1 = JCM 12091 TaxID=1198449 RepID=U3T7I5_9CREN|nr:hypothetical protein [Aeropyrum camini]BAN89482.1 hypothetical protein ACAM_0013 [Aeropyrum camini SY1 = JCM 12091]